MFPNTVTFLLSDLLLKKVMHCFRKLGVIDDYKTAVIFAYAFFENNSRPQCYSTGPGSAVGNVSGYRCVSACNSRGREFDPGPVPYFRGD